MRRLGRAPLAAAVLAVTVAVLPGSLGPTNPATASVIACGGTSAVTTSNGTLPDGATYTFQCPAGTWNGTLFLYSHGYVVPGAANPAVDASDPVTAAWLLGQGFALAGSSYSSTGWAVGQALPDQMDALGVFDQSYRTPTRTIAWGDSLGGMVAAGLLQEHPQYFAGALPMCGMLSGTVATWNTALDAEVAFQRLIDPSAQVVNITNPAGNLQQVEAAASQAQTTSAGKARLALAAALDDVPGWFTPLSTQPGATSYSAQEADQFLWESEVDFPLWFDFRAQLEAQAGGNGSWDTGVNFLQQLLGSADDAEVVALYQAAGLNLQTDLATLQRSANVNASPTALRNFENVTFDGRIAAPVLTVQTTGDGLTVPENDQAYAAQVSVARNTGLLEQLFVNRAGDCSFTPAETIAAIQVLMNRVGTGQWNGPALQSSSLNAAAAALGPQYNIFEVGSNVSPTAPAFVTYQPAPYLRPFPILNEGAF